MAKLCRLNTLKFASGALSLLFGIMGFAGLAIPPSTAGLSLASTVLAGINCLASEAFSF